MRVGQKVLSILPECSLTGIHDCVYDNAQTKHSPNPLVRVLQTPAENTPLDAAGVAMPPGMVQRLGRYPIQGAGLVATLGICRKRRVDLAQSGYPPRNGFAAK